MYLKSNVITFLKTASYTERESVFIRRAEVVKFYKFYLVY